MKATESTIDEEKLHELMVKAVTDFGAATHAALADIGDKLGLYRALDERGPMNSGELADATDTHERYVREWLSSQAAGGYITYDAETGRFHLSPEQRLLVADESSPAFVMGAFQSTIAAFKVKDRIQEAFETGEGVGWHEQDHSLFHATERLFRPGYREHLVKDWIPALDGIESKLQKGARVADVGCGFGASTVIMAGAYPNSQFVGIDYHENSIETARRRAEEAGVGGNTAFETGGAKDYDGGPYDLVTVFDCLHDMGDPAGMARHVRETLEEDGAWMIVEPYAQDRLEDNLNPVGRAFYSVSTMYCTPNSLHQEGSCTLGAQAGESRLREVVLEGGFSQFRRIGETPFNLVFEARP